MMSRINLMDIVAVIFGGLAFLLSANYQFFWPLALVGFIPLITIIYRSSANQSWRIFLLSWLFGFVYLGGIFLWVFETLPLDWVGSIGTIPGYLLAFYTWLVPALSMGFFIGLWGFTFFKLKKNTWPDIFLGSFLWVVAEYAWAYVFSLLAYGHGAIIGLTWTTGFLGYNISASSWLLPFASIGGVWLLSFVVVAINWLLVMSYFSYCRRSIIKSPTILKVGGGLLALVLLAYFAQIYPAKINDAKWRTAVVTTYTPSYSRVTPAEIKEILKKKQQFVVENLTQTETLDLVVFPEDNRFLQYLAENDQRDFIKNFYGDREVLLVDSARAYNKSGSPNLKVTYLNTKTGDFASSEKRFLTPHGEYMPYFSDWFLNLIGLGEWVEGFKNVRGNLPGEYSKGILFRGVHVEATTCSEIMMPNLYREIVDRGAQVLINPASHSLFRGSDILYNQTMNMARVRAVEANRYFIYPSNFMPSFVIDNRGVLVAQAPLDSQTDSVLYTDISLIKEKSFYHRWSKLLPLLLIFGLMGTYLWRSRSSYKD